MYNFGKNLVRIFFLYSVVLKFYRVNGEFCLDLGVLYIIIIKIIVRCYVEYVLLYGGIF